MKKVEFLARIDSYVRPLFSKLPPDIYTKFYSSTRKYFLDQLVRSDFSPIHVPNSRQVKFGNLTFRSPLFNAAGMFKNGEGYQLSYALGAGAYLAGTTTSQFRNGNTKNGVKHPFCPYPASKAASNWMGLPNEGHKVVSERIRKFQRYNDFPIGISVSADPGMEENIALPLLLEGLEQYVDSGVDFIELNESCPNTEENHNTSAIDEQLLKRLEYIHNNFISKQKVKTPIILKFSNDTSIENLVNITRTIQKMDFSGINVGNTSTRYKDLEQKFAKEELSNYRYFYSTFGGGTSGNVLKDNSLHLCSQLVNTINPDDFIVIRTGGVEDETDLINSKKNGIFLNQWYTGFFENFSHFGKDVYNNIYKHL